MHFFMLSSFSSIFFVFHQGKFEPYVTRIFRPLLWSVMCILQCIVDNDYFRGGGGHTLVFRAIKVHVIWFNSVFLGG